LAVGLETDPAVPLEPVAAGDRLVAPPLASAPIGPRTVEQLAGTSGAVERPAFSNEEPEEIGRFAVEGGVDLWRVSSTL
jgi:hypothetical protein